MIKDGQRYLITTDDYFIAPNGDAYKAAWGQCCVKASKDLFGFAVARPSTNWYLEVGGNGKEIIIAGCQVHYAIRCAEKPEDKYQGQTFVHPEDHSIHDITKIYIAE